MRTCVVDCCGEPVKVKNRGLCNKHFTRWSRHRDPNHCEVFHAAPHDRFWKFVRVSKAGCYEWLGSVSPQGYARISVAGRPELAHRWVYETFVEIIPKGMVVDHLCRNRKCVNPEHLQIATHRENMLCGTGMAARNKNKTHCVRGHAFDSVNKNGHRFCRKCARIRAKQRHIRRKAGNVCVFVT